MLSNYASKVARLDVSSECVVLENMPDATDVSEWAYSSVGWAIDNGLVSGVAESDGNYLQPSGNAWRSSMAKMASVLCFNMLKVW